MRIARDIRTLERHDLNFWVVHLLSISELLTWHHREGEDLAERGLSFVWATYDRELLSIAVLEHGIAS